MPPTPVRAADTRRTETPNATMTTLASPTLGPTTRLSAWRVEMKRGQQGPIHAFTSEQVWTTLAGEVAIAVDGNTSVLAPGDTLVVPGRVERQVSALADAELLVAGYGDAQVCLPGKDANPRTPPWIM